MCKAEKTVYLFHNVKKNIIFLYFSKKWTNISKITCSIISHLDNRKLKVNSN